MGPDPDCRCIDASSGGSILARSGAAARALFAGLHRFYQQRQCHMSRLFIFPLLDSCHAAIE